MKNKTATALLCLALCACSQDPAGVRLIQEPAQAPATTALKAKTEPVFYNGKTYKVSLAPVAGGNSAVNIAGMSAAQAKDANALATSALFHFACKDTQKAVLQSPPQFSDDVWHAQGHCST